MQINFSKAGMPPASMQAMRMLTASEALFSKHSTADFAKQVDPLNEETALQVILPVCHGSVYTAWALALLLCGMKCWK